jgi:hypothetical protein
VQALAEVDPRSVIHSKQKNPSALGWVLLLGFASRLSPPRKAPTARRPLSVGVAEKSQFIFTVAFCAKGGNSGNGFFSPFAQKIHRVRRENRPEL